ncbi:FAD/FMN-containing dehydrogenase [Rhodococcus sp. BE178]
MFEAADPDVTARARAAFDDLVAACLALGGSITGEHGVGVLEEPYMESMVGAAVRELMAGIKSVFEPTGILNPGRGF